MVLTKQIQKLKEMSMSKKENQVTINVSEVFHLWSHLTQRYHIIYITKVLINFAKDEDLKIVLTMGIKALNRHVVLLEKEMLTYGIPLPNRPPKETQTTASWEEISDRYIFRRILRGIQAFLPSHTMAFVHSTSPKIRDLFMSFVIQEMQLYDKFLEYGKMKGYEVMPPVYKA
jgi:hypothetical protein